MIQQAFDSIEGGEALRWTQLRKENLGCNFEQMGQQVKKHGARQKKGERGTGEKQEKGTERAGAKITEDQQSFSVGALHKRPQEGNGQQGRKAGQGEEKAGRPQTPGALEHIERQGDQIKGGAEPGDPSVRPAGGRRPGRRQPGPPPTPCASRRSRRRCAPESRIRSTGGGGRESPHRSGPAAG